MYEIEIWSYDTWGNEEEGYTVNDRCKIGTMKTRKIPSDKKIQEIINDYFSDENEVSIDHGCSDETHIYLVRNSEEYSDYPEGEILIEEVQ